MLYANQEMLTYSIFSKDWWFGFLSPPAYYADGINDFLTDKDKVITMPRWKCLFQKYFPRGSTIIILTTGFILEQLFTEEEARQREKKFNEVLKKNYETILIQEFMRDPKNFTRRAHDKILEAHIEYVANAKIYDSTGEIKVIPRTKVMPDSHHQGAGLTYIPRLKTVFLDHLIDDDDFSTRKPLPLRDLLLAPSYA